MKDELLTKLEFIEEQKMYAYAMDATVGLGEKTGRRFLEVFQTPKEVWKATEHQLTAVLKKEGELLVGQRKIWQVEKEYELLQEKKINFTYYGEEEYPKRLRNIPDKPFGIYYKGHLPEENRPSVAIIGARNCSEYGSYVAEQFGYHLATKGVQIISGMARGVDGIAQQAALNAGGDTYAVLGCGVDICYPASHRKMYEDMQEKGGVISTYLPKTEPKPHLFPPRNRIISGLADILLVVEARLKSGTLITVDMALDQGKEIYAVPGRITDRLSDGCNRLIKQGAGIVLSPEDLMKELQDMNLYSQMHKEGIAATDNKKERKNILSPVKRKILDMLDFDPISLDQLRLQMQTEPLLQEMSLPDTMQVLIELSLQGFIKDQAGNYYVKIVEV